MLDRVVTCSRCEFRQRGTKEAPLAGVRACLKSGKDTVEHQQAGDCPMGYFSGPSAPLVQVRLPKPAMTIAERGPKLWAELHKRAWNATNPLNELDWLAAFERRIPCGDCKRHWRSIIEENPPVLTDRDAYFKWTWAVHNWVNFKLHKPQIDLVTARAIQEGGA